MSQSPVTDLSEQASLRYKQGWRALNRLLHEDRSFSGRERNCAFLNCGGDAASFATVSAVTGFDFPDDGRGLATADWDFDGDLDVWLSNRTAPRVRLLKNNTTAKPFVAFKLRGDGRTGNRDGIGARLELHLQGAGRHPVRIKTLRGGEGFLSQSSNWIHFGLGGASGIEKLIVRWPGGRAEEFSGLRAGEFYRVEQGVGRVQAFVPPASRRALTPSDPELPRMEETARVVVPPGLIVPRLAVRGLDGREQAWIPAEGRPTVVTLWASWCAPCLVELKEWAAHRDALAAAGVEVVPLNAEAAATNEEASPAAIAEHLNKLGVPWPSLRIGEAGLHALDNLHRAVLDRWVALPLPTTFLIDTRGELAVLYKGPVKAATLLADLKLAEAGPSERRAAAIPFAGRWLDETAGRSDPKMVAGIMLDHDEVASAIDYLDRCAERLSRRKQDPVAARQAADILYMSGLLKRDQAGGLPGAITALTLARDLDPKDFRVRRELAQALFVAGRGEEASAELLEATSINPSDLGVKNELADLYQRLGRFGPAASLLGEILAANPKDGLVRYHLAVVQAQSGHPRDAIQNFRQSLSDSPRLLDAANELARLLASHPDASIRSAEEAVGLAERLCAITNHKDPRFLDTLGIALANHGRYDQAIDAAQRAMAVMPAGDEAALAPIRARAANYRQNQPYRLPPP